MPHNVYPKYVIITLPFTVIVATDDPAEASTALAANPGSRVVGVHDQLIPHVHTPHVPTPHVPPGPHTN